MSVLERCPYWRCVRIRDVSVLESLIKETFYCIVCHSLKMIVSYKLNMTVSIFTSALLHGFNRTLDLRVL